MVGIRFTMVAQVCSTVAGFCTKKVVSGSPIIFQSHTFHLRMVYVKLLQMRVNVLVIVKTALMQARIVGYLEKDSQ